MTNVANAKVGDEAKDTLEKSAHALAEEQRDLQRAARMTAHFFEPPPLTRSLERARKRLHFGPPSHTLTPKAIEWFLDNYYLIRRVARQVEEELPRGFVRHLPLLASGPAKEKPRIEVFARALVTESSMLLDGSVLRRFVDAYQAVSPLSIAELWALPTMLRSTVLRRLVDLLENADETARDLSSDVERCIRALRVLDTIDWNSLFETTNRVESVLRTDPARVYEQMDFDTRDSYRKVVEALAWSTGKSEEDVASIAIGLANAADSNERRGHVGYYLKETEGRKILEQRLEYRPVGIDRVRAAVLSSPTFFYLAPLAILTFAPLAVLGRSLLSTSASALVVTLALLASLVPFSAVAITILHIGYARLLTPRTLPKLDFSKGLPEGTRTLVVIPTLLGRSEDVASMVRQIELHYLSNPDPRIQFALLTDDVDTKVMSDNTERDALLASVTSAIVALNAKHVGDGYAPFHLLHRELRWNPREDRFMGWERKRGKLEELNKLLRGDPTTSFSRHVGDPRGLLDIQYVITLDSDTELPMGSAHRLVGILAHPLNHAVFDAKSDRVVAGYTVIQPRIETSPSSFRQTAFSRIFAGDIGFDIYTHACSELYQDLFGAGIYVGKGIYDVDSFRRSLDGRTPENTLVSHDLFEGIQGRAALATDVVLFEGYPSSYATYAMRMHRWVRGDWQLFPWLLPKVPTANGKRLWNSRAHIHRWKMLDNLRRSLTSPSLLALLCLSWTCLPGRAALWTIAVVLIFLAPSVPDLLGGRRMRSQHLARVALAISFLAYEATVVIDAIARVLIRKIVTGKNLLQWTSAAHAAFGIQSRSSRAVFWRTMFLSPALSIVIGGAIAWRNPKALLAAAPILVVWLLAPEIARFISTTLSPHAETITLRDRKRLRMLARRTWRFFDAFVGPGDQWLPVDNHQDEPREQTAHRTSPTNIGLMMVATVSAYDFGYIGPSQLAIRLRRAFESISRLQHYQGHLLNWYDTKSLQPLLPRYVSTVDSGNFAGCLVALKQGCADVADAPVLRVEAWDGLRDSIDLLEEVVESAPSGATQSLRSVIARMQQATLSSRNRLEEAYGTLQTLNDETLAELDRELLAFLETGACRHEADLLVALRTSSARLHQQLRQMRVELESLTPWLALKEEAAAHRIVLPTNPRLSQTAAECARLRIELDLSEAARKLGGETSSELDASAKRLYEALTKAESNASALVAELSSLAARADEEVRGMDFKLLYDRERKLFHIGYNATVDQIDAHHYDLLASEARLASYVAIVKRDVPESHWYALGRPMTRVGSATTLLSWGGTMFEYLMPNLLMRSQEGTLIAQTSAGAVEAQIAYGKKNNEPWGVSESAYAKVDADQTYQYRSFGVPGLGFKRGLEEDRVVAPYASLLALSLRPRAVVDNLVALKDLGMLGTYGLFEALDFTPGRTAEQGTKVRSSVVVRSYMAHHQGMLLIALGNFLNDRSMVARFHSDAMIETGDALLNERAPDVAALEAHLVESDLVLDEVEKAPPPAPAPWPSPEDRGPQAFTLSNGHLASLLTSSGGGGLTWNGLALTRFRPDATSDEDGIWLYLRDEDDRQIWLAASYEAQTTYALHAVAFHRRNQGISARVNVMVATADDVEVRQVTLHNETDRVRTLTLTSAGRPVLLDKKQASTHPAFSSMFIESEHESDIDAIVFSRRAQTPEEPPGVLVHRLVSEGDDVQLVGAETDRAAFFGREGAWREPAALRAGGTKLDGRVGTVLDPIMSLMVRVEIRPKQSVTLAFVTTVARSRAAAMDLARKYGSMHAVRWAFRDAEQESARRLARTNLEPVLLPTVQRLFSSLLFDDATMHAGPSVRRAAPANQRRLWAHGISGDDPIVVVRVRDAEIVLLREILAAQQFLRSCGVRFDLVLIDEHATGYVTEGAGTLKSAIARAGVEGWLNRHGGVFIIAADQTDNAEVQHLESCARVVLDTNDASLAAAFSRKVEAPPKLPLFDATLPDDDGDRPPTRPALLFDNGIGGFTPDGRDYVLTPRTGNPTPAPWCNVLASPAFGCLTSESSLGMSWSLNSGENRLTTWSNDPVLDKPSEVLYLRDEETAAVWSTTPFPAGDGGQTLVRHGAGYTTYERHSHGLVQEMTVFVPTDASLKVVRLRIKNKLPRHRRLTATYYAEWVLGSQRETQRSHIISDHDPGHACLLASCDWNAEFSGRVAFLASKEKTHGYTADRTEFIGRRGDYRRPEGLERWGLSGRVDVGVDPCAALQVHLDLDPEQEIETHFVLGQASSREEALALVTRFRDPVTVEASWLALKKFWDDLLGNIRVKTPEPAMDLMLNRWLLYQALSARVFGRTGFYQSSGAFGFRDQLQDVLALLHAAPGMARAHILEAARHQFELGDVLHWWHPPSGRGVRTRCSDDLAWLPYVTGEYVAATGDDSILDELVPFLEGEALRSDEHDRYAEYPSSPSGSTLFEHCRRALEHAVTEGVHGLPLMGDGDWNDGMSRVGSEGRGESVWLGWFLCATMDRFADLARRKKDDAAASAWSARSEKLRAKVEDVAWDGAWYLRAFHDDGSLIGSASSRACQIDSIAQSWAVLSEKNTETVNLHTTKALDAADERLVRDADRLVLLFQPPFDSMLHDPGYIRAYPPGVRENGGQYTHAATWMGFAHAALGEGERATRIFRLLNPALRAQTSGDAALYRIEPYVLAGDIYSCAPWVGRGGWSWYTGAAAWMWRLGVEAILGLRKEDGVLRVDPCISPAWKGFEAWVRHQEQEVHIIVENPNGVAKGIVSMTLDGQKIEGPLVPLDATTPGTRELRIILGSPPMLARRTDDSASGGDRTIRSRGPDVHLDAVGESKS